MYLSCHTYYSFLYGTMEPAELVARGRQAGADVLVLTDINNTSGWYDFLLACDKHQIRPLLGVDFRHERQPCFTAIAKNREGIYAINEFLSAYSASKQYDEPPRSEHIYLIYAFGKKQPHELHANEYIGIRASELNKLYNSAYLQYADKLVAWCPVVYKDASDYHLHEVLQAIDQNALLSKLDTLNIAHHDAYFTSVDKLKRAYSDYSFIVDNTYKLLKSCEIQFDLHTPKNKKSFTGSKPDDKTLLEKLAFDGYRYRYGSDKKALARVQKELRIIDELDFSAYFLITWDILRYAESRGFHWVGRGSGANSIVAYCLKISNVDPIELDLYFERFINPYRTSPPDFDIDFSWDERDEIIDYIFKRYGKGYVCLLATYNTFKGRSIVRELGKVYGLPKGEIDVLVNEPNNIGKHHGLSEQIIETGKKIIDFPDHLSIHAGGILITEEPLYYYTALDMMPKGFPVCQFDMHVAEDWGFYKYDVLSQRGLGHIKEAVEIIRKNKQISVDIHRAKDFFKDENIKKQLKSAHTIGCFYIESPAMRGLLSKLRCDNFISLVAASSIIRPGVAKSGMMKEYISRFHYPDKITYIHPKFKEVLEETYGVMVYQEDVIKIAHHFAGLDLGEADILRRGMSGKSRSKAEFIKVEMQYFANCKKLGYPDELAKEVWRQIESFSGYSFCKAHSASFAVESYQSLFLKTYYPKEFMVAVINNFGGFYHTELYVHEARMSGAVIEAPCINNSDYKTNIKGDIVYLGFIHILNMESEFAQLIVHERTKNGPYLGLRDFIQRTGAPKEQLNLLIRIGAFRCTGRSKQQLLWEKNNYLLSK
ncbi:MAG: DNA polymerase III subunit alpha, partial [Bacteroidota bacterium]|nr:DNA polymerase III subunit alpha [Bacteroidota bacterium]